MTIKNKKELVELYQISWKTFSFYINHGELVKSDKIILDLMVNALLHFSISAAIFSDVETQNIQ